MKCLVMGGHAVRFYGFARNTDDFDLHLATDDWGRLDGKLLASLPNLAGNVVEGDSWRPRDFRRFQIGTLPNGREEWLEFWRQNHLLAPFAEMYTRRQVGEYGGRPLSFISLPDLIRSKETERKKDWQDVDTLQEILDRNNVYRVKVGALPLCPTLAQIRSRMGLECFALASLLKSKEDVATAISMTTNPVTQALLLPFAPRSTIPAVQPPIEDMLIPRLRSEEPFSPRHLTYVEIVRSSYRAYRQMQDRKDKEDNNRKSRGAKDAH
jgi:hypothetical protein